MIRKYKNLIHLGEIDQIIDVQHLTMFLDLAQVVLQILGSEVPLLVLIEEVIDDSDEVVVLLRA